MYQAAVLSCAIAQIVSLIQGRYGGYFRLHDAEPIYKILTKKRLTHDRLRGLSKADRGELLVASAVSPKQLRYRFVEPTLAPYVLMRNLDEGQLGGDSLERLMGAVPPAPEATRRRSGSEGDVARDIVLGLMRIARRTLESAVYSAQESDPFRLCANATTMRCMPATMRSNGSGGGQTYCRASCGASPPQIGATTSQCA